MVTARKRKLRQTVARMKTFLIFSKGSQLAFSLSRLKKGGRSQCVMWSFGGCVIKNTRGSWNMTYIQQSGRTSLRRVLLICSCQKTPNYRTSTDRVGESLMQFR